MSQFMTYDYWEKNYQPIKNNISKYPDDSLIHFETYGDEYEFVKKCYEQDPNQIWTEVDGDSGTYIISGLHFVNRISYYITKNLWNDEYTEIPTWCYRNCDCIDEVQNGILTYEGDPNPDCEECHGEGSIDIPCDTVEDLQKIYEGSPDIVG